MTRGAAALGLADAIVPTREEANLPVGERVVVARLAPAAVVPTAWEVHSGNTYKASWIFAVDGSPCDVLDVSSVTYPRGSLSRAVTLAQCIATAGTWYYSLDELYPASLNLDRWGDGFEWGASDWGGYPSLYVNLGGLSPVAELVTVAVEVLAATRSLVLPTLNGTDELGGIGSFDTWASGNPSGWTIALSGDGASAQVAGYDSAYAVEISCGRDKDEVKGEIAADATLTLVPGQVYELSGFYFCDDPALKAMLRVESTESATVYRYVEDGRHVLPTDEGFTLAHSGGGWRYASFIFRARDNGSGASTVNVTLAANKSGDLLGSAARVRFGQWAMYRVRRFARAHGRIVGDVTVESGINSPISFGGKTTGGISLTLANNDGALDTAWSELTWSGSHVAVDLLARRGRNLSSLEQHGRLLRTPRRPWTTPVVPTLSDRRRVASGVVQEPSRNDDALSIAADEFRALLYERRAATRTYPSDLDPDMDPRIAGRARPVALGSITEIEPARIGKTSEGVGVYELADPQWSSGIYALDSLTLYADSDAAGRRDATMSLNLLDVPGAITSTLAQAKFQGDTALKPFVLDTEHEYLSVTVNGTTYHLRLLIGSESVETLTVNGDGTDNGSVDPGFGAIGAPTVWEAVLNQAGGQARTNSTTPSGGSAYASVTAAALPSVTSIVRVSLKATVYVPIGTLVPEQANGGAYLYVKIGGTRYYSSLFNVWGLLSNTPIEIMFDWDTNPATTAPWLKAEVDAAEWGIRWYRGTGAGITNGYMYCDLLRPEARVFLSSAPTASAPGICIPQTLATRLQAEGRRQLGGTLGPGFSVSYSDSTRKITIAGVAPITTLSILTSTGRQKSMAGWIGYDTSADHTGSLSYEAEQAIYDPTSDVDTPILRAAIRGYKDDATGTYTGAPGQPIERDCDVAHFLAVEFFDMPSAWIGSGFATARTRSDAKTLALYITDEQSVSDVFDAIERAAVSDIVFKPPTDQASPVTIDFVPFTAAKTGRETNISDEAWVSFSQGERRRSDQAATVEVKWGRTLPLNGTRTASDSLGPVLRGTDVVREVETDLASSAQAQTVADALLPFASGVERVSGTARGLLLHLAADNVTITRDRAKLNATLFRLESVRSALRAGTTDIVAIKVDTES